MGFPFLIGSARKQDQLVAVDLGSRTTKAVHVQRKGETIVLTRYALLDAPIYEKSFSVDLLSEHLKAVSKSLDARTKRLVLAIGVTDVVVRHADMPTIPVSDMRQILKNNSKTYLQQELPNYVFDCHILASSHSAKGREPTKGVSTTVPKQKVLVCGAKQQLMDDLQAAAQGSGFVSEAIVPGLVAPVNAFERAMPELFSKEAVALIDIGFRNSTICVLEEGELSLNRVVAIGGDKLTAGLAEAMGISYAEAEGIKLGMPQEVRAQLEALVVPLGRELRALIDFFEHQRDRQVTHVFVSGGSARSDVILEILQTELMVECKRWNPACFLQQALPSDQVAEMEQVGPQLAVAIGACASVF